MELAGINIRNIANGFYILKNLKKLKQSQFYSKEELMLVQTEKLKHILWQAINYVPYYKSLNIKVNFENFSLNELQKFPVMSKQIMQYEYKNFISDKYDYNKLQFKSTSGSSGMPFKIAKSYYSDAIEYCMMLRAWSMTDSYDYTFRDPCVVLRSYSPKPNEPLYKHDKILNYWFLSPYDINQKNLDIYLDIFKKSKAKLLRGYPSSLYILTLLLKENNIRIPQIKTLFTSSENLLPQYKKVIEDYWQLPLIDWYGQNERTVTVQKCAYGNYHNNDEYGIVELDTNNQIIATSLNNDVMPLIRYATNDIAIPTQVTTCACGRGLSIPFEGIDGRADDLLMKEDGTVMATVNIYNAMEKFQDVKQFKIIQEVDKSVQLYLSENKPLSKDYINKIEQELYQRLGNVPLITTIVQEVERNRLTGKIKSIESRIKF